MGGAWTSGINLYLTIALLGIANRLGVIELPGNLGVLSNLAVITLAIIIYLIEFFADKIPFVDSAWDSVHTFIRPVGGALLASSALSNSPPAVQVAGAMVCGTVALDAHLTKATTRVAINSSPEPFTNSIASVTEDGLVFVALWLAWKHPVITIILVLAFVVFSIWFLKIMFRFLKKVFRFLTGNNEDNDPEDDCE